MAVQSATPGPASTTGRLQGTASTALDKQIYDMFSRPGPQSNQTTQKEYSPLQAPNAWDIRSPVSSGKPSITSPSNISYQGHSLADLVAQMAEKAQAEKPEQPFVPEKDPAKALKQHPPGSPPPHPAEVYNGNAEGSPQRKRAAKAILEGIGADSSNKNAMTFMLAWMQSEGVNPAYFNWLGTTMSGYGGHSVNGDGVKAYRNFKSGVNATIATLLLDNYNQVVKLLKAGANPISIAKAVGKSPWGTSMQLMIDVLEGWQ